MERSATSGDPLLIRIDGDGEEGGEMELKAARANFFDRFKGALKGNYELLDEFSSKRKFARTKVNFIKDKEATPWIAWAATKRIKDRMEKFRNVKIFHIWREGNSVTDALSKVFSPNSEAIINPDNLPLNILSKIERFNGSILYSDLMPTVIIN